MMPNEATDEFAALTQFQSEFNNRYGTDALITPSFYLGTLDGAIQVVFLGIPFHNLEFQIQRIWFPVVEIDQIVPQQYASVCY